ncbi:hypothetical protein LguiB_027882 [Lonicera macranthoides]
MLGSLLNGDHMLEEEEAEARRREGEDGVEERGEGKQTDGRIRQDEAAGKMQFGNKKKRGKEWDNIIRRKLRRKEKLQHRHSPRSFEKNQLSADIDPGSLFQSVLTLLNILNACNGKILMIYNNESIVLYDPTFEAFGSRRKIFGIRSEFHAIAHVPSLISLKDVGKAENLKECFTLYRNELIENTIRDGRNLFNSFFDSLGTNFNNTLEVYNVAMTYLKHCKNSSMKLDHNPFIDTRQYELDVV